jgi:hypothetical protein
VTEFHFPGGADRTVVMGATGTGKTIAGAWILSHQNFSKRPWVALDFKDEEFWDQVGSPPMRKLRLGDMPGKRGLYRMRVLPGQEDALEDWLWKVWKRGNIGLFCDEVSLMPQRDAFKAILRQGRSLRIPVISCTQRPVDVDREVFTESQYKAIFRLDDVRDYKVIQGFTRNAPIDKPLPPRWFYWYDGPAAKLYTLRPVPKPVIIASDLKRDLPTSWMLGG